MGPLMAARMQRDRTWGAVLAMSFAWTAVGQGLAGAEYYWDNDPGAGNGLAILAADGAWDEVIEVLLLESSALPGVGTHTLGLRARNAQGSWGPTFTTVVVIDPAIGTVPAINITLAEYFWDNDPGAGNGVPLIAMDGNYNAALETIMLETDELPAIGAHTLSVRSRDANANWGVPFSVIVDVLPGAVSFPDVEVTAAECFVNTDPGEGSGTPLLALDGDFGSAFEALRGGSIPVPVIAGTNVLWTRARDTNGAWGPAFGIVANIDTTITGTVGIPDIAQERALVLAPNPIEAGRGFLIRSARSLGPTRVRITDAEGRIVAEHRFNGQVEWYVPLSDVAAGTYHVGILPEEGGMIWRRLVVQ